MRLSRNARSLKLFNRVESEASSGDGAKGRRRRVLVIEDHADTRFVMRAILERAGYEVIEAEDGSQGVERALECEPDVVVTDLMMPGMDGFKVAKTLVEENGSAPPIILASAHVEGRVRELKAFAEAFDAVLTKPVEPARLTEAIRSVLSD